MAKKEWDMQLEKLGYEIIKNVFPKNDLLNLQMNMRHVFANFNVGYDDKSLFEFFQRDEEAFVNCAKLCHQIPEIWKIAGNENIISILKNRGVKFPVVNIKPVVLFSSKQLASHEFYWKSKPHQDYWGMRGSENSLVLWIPIFDIKERHGFLEVVPYSHKRGLLSHKKFGPGAEIKENINDPFVSVRMEIGDILVFSSMLIHKSGENASNDIRWTLSLRYDDAAALDYIQRKYACPYKYSLKWK